MLFVLNIDVLVINYINLNDQIIKQVMCVLPCDAPNPGGLLTTRQPAEYLCVSYYETHT